MSQFRAASEAHHVLELSQRFVAAKIENQRTPLSGGIIRIPTRRCSGA